MLEEQRQRQENSKNKVRITLKSGAEGVKGFGLFAYLVNASAHFIVRCVCPPLCDHSDRPLKTQELYRKQRVGKHFDKLFFWLNKKITKI